MIAEPVAVTLLVVNALEKLGVSYFVGGSLASTLHGVVRTTLDTDLVAELHSEHVTPLIQMLQGTFYMDAEAVNEAVHRLDLNYLRQWAIELGVADLLEKALTTP
jgi:hypothetical protein